MTNQYQMRKCRQLLIDEEMRTRIPLVETLLTPFEVAVDTQTNGAFDMAYSLIDTVCKTILSERDVDDPDQSVPKRFKATLRALDLMPPSRVNDERGIKGMYDAMNGLLTAVRGLCSIRNGEGIYSHGKVATFTHADELQLMLVADTTDTLVHYLLSAHFNYPIPAREILYEDHTEFNEFLDELYEPAEILGQIFPASQILYDSDEGHVAYKEALLSWEQEMSAYNDEDTV